MDDPNLQVPSGAKALVWQLVEKLDEQRCYPRVPLNQKSALRTDSGVKFAARAINISPDGLQVRCDVASARLLHPHGGRVDPERDPQVNVALALSVGEVKRTIVARCKLLYLTTVDSEPRCVVGLRFAHLDRQSERIVNEFFSEELAMTAGGPSVAHATSVHASR